MPYLAAGAIDIVRQTGLGITGQMKLANLAEMFGLNCHGGNPHVLAAIRIGRAVDARAIPVDLIVVLAGGSN